MVKIFRFLPKTEVAVHRCSIKKMFRRVLINSQIKQICWSLFLNKVAGLLPRNLFLKILLYRSFPVNFAKYLTALFSQSASGLLLLLNILSLAVSTSPPKCYFRPIFFWFLLNVFRNNNVNRLHIAISGVPRTRVVTELIYCS